MNTFPCVIGTITFFDSPLNWTRSCHSRSMALQLRKLTNCIMFHVIVSQCFHWFPIELSWLIAPPIEELYHASYSIYCIFHVVDILVSFESKLHDWDNAIPVQLLLQLRKFMIPLFPLILIIELSWSIAPPIEEVHHASYSINCILCHVNDTIVPFGLNEIMTFQINCSSIWASMHQLHPIPCTIRTNISFDSLFNGTRLMPFLVWSLLHR